MAGDPFQRPDLRAKINRIAYETLGPERLRAELRRRKVPDVEADAILAAVERELDEEKEKG